jgi:hypothetical protein
VGFVVNTVAQGLVFLPVRVSFPCQYHFTIAPYSSEYYCYQKDKGKESRNLKQSSTHWNIGEHWIEKYFDVVLFR